MFGMRLGKLRGSLLYPLGAQQVAWVMIGHSALNPAGGISPGRSPKCIGRYPAPFAPTRGQLQHCLPFLPKIGALFLKCSSARGAVYNNRIFWVEDLQVQPNVV
jgi:hypothetical protein